MGKINYPVKQEIFKVKKHWWMWALGLLLNFFAITSAIRGYYFLLIAILIADLIILPDACHFRYILDDKFLDIKGIGFPGPVILLASITKVDHASLMTFRGFGLKLYTDSFNSLRIKYMDGRREKTVIVAPKDFTKFINELGARLDKTVMLIDSGFEFIQGKKSK